MSRTEFIAFRKSLGRTPPLERMTVRARSLSFAVWSSPPVAGATPLLLVNGGLLYDHALLWPALSPLAASRQVFLYDQRGRGESEAPTNMASTSIEDDAADIGAIRRSLGIRRWDVLGHSWGGGIAMLAVAADAAATRRLVTVDSVGPTSSWISQLSENAKARATPENRAILLELEGRLSEPDAGAHGAFSRAAYASWFADRKFANYFVPPEAVSDTGAVIVARVKRDGYDWRPAIQSINTPTLVLHGTEDALPYTVAEELVATLAHARLAAIPNAGHMPFWEAPQAFFAVVEEFLGARAV